MDPELTHSADTPLAGRAASPKPTRFLRASETTMLDGWRQNARETSVSWTPSSKDFAEFPDADNVGPQDYFIQEFNRLAQEVGPILPSTNPFPVPRPQQLRRSWISRTFRRQVSEAHSPNSTQLDKKIKKRRSVGDLALHLVNGAREDNLKGRDLPTLVRLCGKSTLHLPSEYSPGSLILPTCFRATAHYLVQHGPNTRGVFRIPGSVRTVNALYSYYSADGEDSDDISSTICSPSLPSHINAGPHEVGSIFKRLLSGLPGGILGSLLLFEKLAEVQKTHKTKDRGRLIALAIGATVKSHLQQDLIFAVFGLLGLIGRAAEQVPRDLEPRRSHPTSDLMGYGALGIVFGPLLVGDLLHSYNIPAVDDASSSNVAPTPPSNMKIEGRATNAADGSLSQALIVDRISVANGVAEMLITNWRDVVRPGYRCSRLGQSAQESFRLRLPLSLISYEFRTRIANPC
ncbi:hypothetical protein VTJ49DRAFT_6692 [Mycothermus thermophilus]|uniref:Rho-GAP domain-containing protein n=1 Tax=Humicola insolens TaxID=85995 RepID=A0ABR3VIK7_HUMIN